MGKNFYTTTRGFFSTSHYAEKTFYIEIIIRILNKVFTFISTWIVKMLAKCYSQNAWPY